VPFDFPQRRLNEVASPAASATDASRVISLCQCSTALTGNLRQTDSFLVCLEVPCFQVATIQI
jgi:hypothetical protein